MIVDAANQIKDPSLASGGAVNRDDAIASALDAVAHHDAEVARGLHAQMRGDLSLEVRRHYADEAAHYLEIRRQCVTAALQRLIGDDLTDVECADLANELTMPHDVASRIRHRSERPREVPGARRAARA